jgi:translation initiation factor 2 alpha subunit (eIF-2alpha)
MSLTNCRFYEEKYPEIDSFVMVNVKQVRACGLGMCVWLGSGGG